MPPAPAPGGHVVRPTLVAGSPGGLTFVHLAIVVVALFAGAALFLSGYSIGRQAASEPGTPPAEEEAFRPFWDAYRFITTQYAGGEVDRRTLVEGAIDGMIESLHDPYSSYLTPEEYRQSLQDISGEFEGVGIEVAPRRPDGTNGADCVELGPDCRLVVVAPLDGSPAQKAGIRAGDVIVAVDGASLDGLRLDEARDRIRGPKGTVVTLTLERDGQRLEVTVTRDVIVQREVVTRELAGGTVGYIRLASFSDHAADQFARAVEAQVEAGRKKLIVDLRGNPGGYITAARAVASQFISEGPIFWQENAAGEAEPTNAEPGGAATDPAIRVVVLIDRGTASASEIVAAALKETGRATIVGERSFGKGTVQQWQELPNDSGGIRLTIAKWLTPKKHWIHGTGVTPDVVVDVPADLPPGEDPILDRALEILSDRAGALAFPRAA
ncbi:MAG TPA: S41 family peptidase [Candidatus Limnocylindrales bacterium]|nr:S41 family peptidase [Candidatus Limnocylindrales bacterium]